MNPPSHADGRLGSFFESSATLEVFRSAGASGNPLKLGLGAVMAGLSRRAGSLGPHIRHVELHTAGWPDDAPPVKIAFLSDLHVGGQTFTLDDLARTVDRVNAEQPDIVILGGDYVNQYEDGERIEKGQGGPMDPGFTSPHAIAAQLGRLAVPGGVFAVLGNHDWSYGGAEIRDALQGYGITVLENEAARTRVKGQPVWIAGLDDHTRKPDATRARAAIGDDPHVLVAHNPTDTQDVPAGAAIALSGHTHGGQAGGTLIDWLASRPLLKRLIDSDWGHKHLPKELREHLESPQGVTATRTGAPLYTSSGMGTSTAPLRFGKGAESEVAMITLKGRAKGPGAR